MGESDYYIDEKIMNVISEKITGLELLPNFSMGKKKKKASPYRDRHY